MCGEASKEVGAVYSNGYFLWPLCSNLIHASQGLNTCTGKPKKSCSLRVASTSAEARDAYLKDAEQLLLDSGNIIPLYSRQQPYQIREGVAGAVNDGLGAWYFGSVRRVTQ